MLLPDVPRNEKERLQALYALSILDSETEDHFDRLTRLAANYFNVKTCLISLVDSDRQWFKSKFGFQSCQTPRDISFCAHAILQDDIMVIDDARNDERFADNPLVIGEPHIVFYAGAPLSSVDGYKIGTLCLIDDKPHSLTPEQHKFLRDIADLVEREINDLSLRELRKERHEALLRTQHMLAVFPDIVFIIDKDLQYVASNDHSDLLLPKEEFIGRTVTDVLPKEVAELFEDSIIQVFRSGRLVEFNYQLEIQNKQNHFEARAKQISDIEALVVVRNTTEEHARLTELERLSMVAQQTTNGVVITDLDEKVLWVNEGFTRITGYSLDEIEGKVPGRLLQGPQTDPETVQTIREAIEKRKSYSVDIINYRKNGQPYWVRISCNPWSNEQGEIIGYIAIQSDIDQEVKNIEQIQKSQKLLTAVIDANSIGTWILNLQTRSLEINEQWAKLLGYTLADLEPVDMDTWQDLTHPDDLKICLKMFEDYDKGLIDYYEYPIRMKHKDGHWVWIRTSGSITSRTADGRAEFTLGTHLDINAQMLAEAHLKEQYDYMQVLFNNMIDGILGFNSDNKIQSFNPSAETIFGYSHDEIINKDIGMLIPELQGQQQLVGQHQYIEGKRKNGEVFPMEIGIVGSKYKQEPIFIGILRDVTERKNAEEAINKLAYFDGLSGLPNRRLMFDRLQHALLKIARNKSHLALLFVDFDNFKQINDSAGHDVGDVLLQQIALRLRGAVRESDTVARLGGDEFIVILEDLDPNSDIANKQAASAAKKIKSLLNKPYQLQAISYIGSCSIGIALCGDPSFSSAEFLKQADLAMYEAKLSGRNAISFFTQEMQERVNSRIKVEQDLRNALNNCEFELFYQAQVDIKGKCLGAEGLLRWRHPDLGLVSPLEFIPIAEESGLMVSIGRWVLEEACQCLARWSVNPALRDFVLAINVSVVELNQTDWVEIVLDTVRKTGADPTKLKLEVTESVMAYDIEQVVSKLSKLRLFGINISLDDFGTGYSSLTYLKSLPLNQLKIDKSFVRDILDDPDDKAIAETIISLARMMRLDVIAEGVETKEQLEMLKKMGCGVFQGYLFSKPQPLMSFEGSKLIQAQ
jgi:diguanylate cyclase (GGDEF)-like protein/PAS domain S-box-containing protein